MSKIHNRTFWNERWQQGETGWDIGEVSTPLAHYIDQLTDKSTKILIPGAGNAYEAEYLHQKGFTDVHVVDFSTIALDNLKKRIRTFPDNHLFQGDFFKHEGEYELILEQTFFCALHPSQRVDYKNKMADLLLDNAKLVGLLFQIELFSDRPPYGGFKDEYEELFSNKFHIDIMETAYNSIETRKGNELFIKLRKQ